VAISCDFSARRRAMAALPDYTRSGGTEVRLLRPLKTPESSHHQETRAEHSMHSPRERLEIGAGIAASAARRACPVTSPNERETFVVKP
jgi:hypothetical protein